jgi:hypothetical protein
MADITSVDLARLAGDNLEQASPDLLRAMVKTFAEALMGAEADAACGAAYRQVSEDRMNYRNGYRDRRWDTRTGTEPVALSRAPSAGQESCITVDHAGGGVVDACAFRVADCDWRACRFQARSAVARRRGSRRRSLPRLSTMAAKSSSAWQAGSPRLAKRRKAVRSLRWPLTGSTVAPRRL